jgi:pimeloyl-ACP methyl ester carboxylesterase
MAKPNNVVLVHGGFVDGSGWRDVYQSLRRDDLNVRVVQNPTLSVEGDADTTRRILDEQDGPTVLVGHSSGGAVITAAGTHPNVAALVYIAAFAPDQGESVNTLLGQTPPDAPAPPILPPQDGFLLLDREKFRAAFAADVSEPEAQFMADSQVPWGADALGEPLADAAWRHKPSWYLVATNDRMIAPALQRTMATRAGATVAESPASHAVYVSKPDVVAGMIKQAVQAVN